MQADRDVIVVGARCAGSPLAMLLARKGHDVLLVERAVFPKDTISTLYIHRPGVVLLDDWGLLDELIATGCPTIDTGRFFLDDVELTGPLPAFGGGCVTLAPRRTILDSLLLKAAADSGVEVADGISVTDLIWDDGRVAGVRLRDGSSTSLVRARLVVGADGMSSTVARKVGAAIDRQGPRTASSYYAIYDIPGPRHEVAVFAGDGVGGLCIPTNNGHTVVSMAWARERSDEVRRDLEASYRRATEVWPALGEQVAAGTQVERIVGKRNSPNFMRRSHGPGWALAGDAGYMKDPVTGQGITDAFQDAHSLAGAIHDGLAGDRDLDRALADHQRRRDTTAGPFFEWTIRTGTLDPIPPRTKELFRAIAASREATTQFFGINAKLTDPRQFFSPEKTAALVEPNHSPR